MMYVGEEGRKAYDQATTAGNLNYRVESGTNPFSQDAATGSLPGVIDAMKREQELQRQLKQKECELAASLAKRDYGMKDKFSLIAELFQMDVMSEEDALKACKTVIEQHARKKPIQGHAERD